MRDLILDALEPLANIPSTDRNAWLGASEDGVKFLRSHYDRDTEVILFASGRYTVVHAVLAPIGSVTPPDKTDLRNAWINTDETWTLERSYSGGGAETEYDVRLRPPLAGSSSKSLEGGEKLIFRRRLSGVHKGPTPTEISQKLVHSLGTYFLPERNAYCRLNEKGDIDDVIKIHSRKGETDLHSINAVTIRADDLHEYMALTNTALFVRFDFTRTVPGGFSSWGSERYTVDENDIFYDGCSMPGHASFSNGYLIVRPNLRREDLVQSFKRECEVDTKKYEIFKFFDPKNGRLVETPIGPEKHVSYFKESPLPWDISPVFFRPEVLQRFKADPEKYTLEDRSIRCRNAWSLKTYDINEAGQVHTYVIYLSDLPYEEQVYWKAFNEWPKSGISKRAYTTDILGEWDQEYDPLRSLKIAIKKLDETQPSWWKPRDQTLHDAVKYPSTDSIAEWGNELLALDHLLTEGFIRRKLRHLASQNGLTVEKEWGSLKLLELMLEVMGTTKQRAEEIIRPLRELSRLRNSTKAHGDPAGRELAVADARTTHGTLRMHFRNLAAQCDNSLNVITAVLNGKN
ncbi:MAG: hypothetical protein AAGH90_08940 [Pseudomonadota bacterium]